MQFGSLNCLHYCQWKHTVFTSGLELIHLLLIKHWDYPLRNIAITSCWLFVYSFSPSPLVVHVFQSMFSLVICLFSYRSVSICEHHFLCVWEVWMCGIYYWRSLWKGHSLWFLVLTCVKFVVHFGSFSVTIYICSIAWYLNTASL